MFIEKYLKIYAYIEAYIEDLCIYTYIFSLNFIAYHAIVKTSAKCLFI